MLKKILAACLVALSGATLLGADLVILHSGIVNDTVSNAQCPAALLRVGPDEYVTTFMDRGDGVAQTTTYFSRTKDRGRTWSRPFMKYKPKGKDVGGAPGFTQLKDGQIIGAMSLLKHTDTSEEGFRSYRSGKAVIVTVDLKKKKITTLAELESPDACIPAPMGTNFVKLSNGDMLLPCYIYPQSTPEPGFPYGSGFFRSSDGGKTWGKFERAFQEFDTDPAKQYSFNESVIFEKEDHTLVAFARIDSRPVNNMWKVTSKDFGKTWSMPEETDIPATYPTGIKTQGGYYVMVAGYLKDPIPRTTTVFFSEDGEHFTPLGPVWFSRPAGKNGRPFNTATGGMQAIIEVDKDVFLVTFYGADPKLKGRDNCYVDSCLIRIKR